MVLIIAHRGASAYEPENTIAAFRKVVELKANGAECDIRLTKDKKLAVIHDAAIDRTTSGKGLVKDYSLKELKTYNIPELQEVIDIIKPAKMLLLIEIKERGTESAIVEAVKKNKIENQAVVISFYADSLKKVKKLGNIKTGFIFNKDVDAINIAKNIKADFILPRADIINKQMTDAAHKARLKVITWVIDDAKSAKKMASFGVDGIATNKPDLLKR